jgi:hypothetical protein
MMKPHPRFARNILAPAIALCLAGAAVPATAQAPAGPTAQVAQAQASSHIEAATKKLKTKKPKITGEAKVGEKLTAVTGKWGPGKVNFKYQWLVAGKAVKKATKKSYVVAAEDAGKKVSVKVTGSKKGYKTAKKTSAAKKVPVPDPAVEATPAPATDVVVAPTPVATPAEPASTSGVPLSVIPPPATVDTDGTIKAGWAALFNGTPIAANEVRVVAKGETIVFAIRFADQAGLPVTGSVYFQVETPGGTTLSEITTPLDETGAALFTWVSTVETTEPLFLWWKLVSPPAGFGTAYTHVHINADATYNPSGGGGGGSDTRTCLQWFTLYMYGQPYSRTCTRWSS